MWRKTTLTLLMGSLAAGPMLGCENMPGDDGQQGAVIGGLGGAIAGAAVAGSDDRGIGALIGAVAGAGGGYLIGAKVDEKDKDDAKKKEEALKASQNAEANPASADAARNATTADVNDDGFVTLDEVVAMEQAGLTDKEMIRRLERTQQYFSLNEQQEGFLRERGVSDTVVVAMRDMNRESSDARLASDKVDGSKPISHEAR